MSNVEPIILSSSTTEDKCRLFFFFCYTQSAVIIKKAHVTLLSSLLCSIFHLSIFLDKCTVQSDKILYLLCPCFCRCCFIRAGVRVHRVSEPRVTATLFSALLSLSTGSISARPAHITELKPETHIYSKFL